MRKLDLLFIAAWAAIATAPSVSLAQEQAELVMFSGDVKVTRGKTPQAVTQGMKILRKEVITTGDDGLALIKLASGALIKVNAKTQMALDHLSDFVQLRLDQGSVFSKVPKQTHPLSKFQIRTKAAVLGVRGTHFFTGIVTKEKVEDVWMCVHEGEVRVLPKTGGGPVVVKEGQGVFVATDRQIQTPRAFEWTKKLNWNMETSEGDLVNPKWIEDANQEIPK